MSIFGFRIVTAFCNFCSSVKAVRISYGNVCVGRSSVVLRAKVLVLVIVLFE